MPSTNATNSTICASADGGDDMVAEPSDEREIGGHHRDLAELRQRDRQRELDRFDKLDAPDRRTGRRGG